MNEELIAALASEQTGGSTLPSGHGLKLDLSWRPKLNPTQKIVYDCRARYMLVYGPRGSGKGQVGLHSLVRHCVNNRNAFAAIIVKEISVATEGGIWESLMLEILPQWRSGNFDRKTGKFTDKGCGIEFTPQKLDFHDKKLFTLVSNRFGGYSMIKLISMNVGHAVEDKAKGKIFSFALFDEAQTFDNIDYIQKIGQQVGRRQGITDPQQLMYLCNPKGPSHFLYQYFFTHGKDADGHPIEVSLDTATGTPFVGDKPVKSKRIFHVPTTENLHNLMPGYWEDIQELCANDEIERLRMIEGVWVDKPEGDALFRDEWKDTVHIRGDIKKSQGIIPVSGHDIVLGWDPGSAHTAVSLFQYFVTLEKTYWLLFDEMNTVGKYMPYRKLVPRLIDRLLYWENLASEMENKPVEFRFTHISDDSAFNQFRAKDGSFDAQDIEDISREVVQKRGLPERFIIKMKACPKGPHSVEARVRIAKDLLIEGSLLISAACAQTREAFMGLEEDPKERTKPKRSKHLHPFDATTYPLLFFQAGKGRSAVKRVGQPEVVPEFYVVGKA